MIEPWHVIAAALVAGGVTFLLRAVPFAVVGPLLESELVGRLAIWMPAGVLSILALVMLLDAADLAPGDPVDIRQVGFAVTAAAVTVMVHLLGGRRTLLSIAAGTGAYVLLVNLL
ncbi:MAG: AzlD domain-containing protein [Micrococcus sp.]|nr:AzlD domain-containing protein [Micrococcus sp.]